MILRRHETLPYILLVTIAPSEHDTHGRNDGRSQPKGGAMFKKIFFLALSLLFVGTLAAQAQPPTTFFGAKLNKHTQPSNAGTGDFCNVNTKHQNCSFVLMQAYQCEFKKCTDGHLAPMDGTIRTVSLIACAPGSFVLQIAKADAATNKAQVVSSGPVINYKGDPKQCSGNTYKIESFTVNVPVQAGDYLAVDAQKVGFVRCSGGGANMLLFDPPLADGVAARKSNGQDGCFMLLQAIYETTSPRASFAPWHP